MYHWFNYSTNINNINNQDYYITQVKYKQNIINDLIIKRTLLNNEILDIYKYKNWYMAIDEALKYGVYTDLIK